MNKKITFNRQPEQTPAVKPLEVVESRGDDLYKERPGTVHHPGQDFAEIIKENQVGTLRHGYERLGHMYSLGIPLKFEELQGRHPFDFVAETKQHYQLHPDPVKKPAQPEDTTLFDVREWLEPLLRKGQLYWDYCRDKWLEKEGKVGSACAPIGCIYSLWSVTENYLRFGGFVFMAVYLFITVVFIIPFIYMELTLGQFHRQGLVKAIKQTCPLFQGLAYLMLLSSVFEYLLAMTPLSWLLYYAQTSVYYTMPWRYCDPHWSSNRCKATLDHDQEIVYEENERTAAVEWFRVHVTKPWSHWDEIYRESSKAKLIASLLPNYRVVFCFLVLIMIFRHLMKLTCRPLGTIMLGLFYYAFISFGFSLLAFQHTVPPDVQNKTLQWFFKSDHLKYFYHKDTWTTAIRQAVVGSGIGTGIYITFGSHNTFSNDNIKRTSVLSGLASFLVHFFFVTFFSFCVFTIRTTRGFKNATVQNYGEDAVFEIFAQVVAQHHDSGVAYTVFFGIIGGLLLIASLRVICSLHTIRQYFIDRDKEYYEPARVSYNYWEHDRIRRQQRYTNLNLSPKRKGRLITKIMLYCGLFHLATFLPGGSFVLYTIEALWYSYIPMFIVMVECVAVFFFAGVRTLNEYVRRMTTWQVTLWYRFAWKCFMPLIPLYYIVHPPRVHRKFHDIEVPEFLQFIGYICAVVPLFFLYVNILHYWRRSRAQTWWNKFLLEVTPEHEHVGMIAGRKPSTRLHWMHHLQVPAGISRGPCLPSFYGSLRRPDPCRFDWDNKIMNFFWYALRFRCINGLRDACIKYPEYTEYRSIEYHMFPPIAFPMKLPKKEAPFPEYLPNQAIKRVHKLKKYRNYQKQRKQWLNDRVDLERERMAADHDDNVTTAAAKAHAEDEERAFFDLFNSGDEDGLQSTSTNSTEDSFDLSSDYGRGKKSSPSVSTSDTFDSQNSIFKGSADEEAVSRHKPNLMDSDSISEEDDDVLEEDLDGLEDADDVVAPLMDYGDEEVVPFDEETDSWELEALENIHEDDDLIGEHGKLDKETSEEETDTDDLIYAMDRSQESEFDAEEENGEDDNGEEEDKEEEVASTAEQANKTLDVESVETNSWSISCESESSCSSLSDDENAEDSFSDDDDYDYDDDESDDEDLDKDEARRKDESEEGSVKPKTGKNLNMKFFRNMAERLDNFLHISKKKEMQRIGIIQEQVGKARAKRNAK